MQTKLNYVDTHVDSLIDDLKTGLRIPSISSDPEHKPDMAKMADLLSGKLTGLGFENVQTIPTPGHPAVYGEWLHQPGKPTLLIYGHYDVQPVDPVELWTSPPFEPDIRGEKLYARGAVDDKGQVYMHLAAISAWLKSEKKLPLNVKFILEGEEEVGSEHFEELVVAHTERLSADYVLISDTPMLQKGLPGITYGLRGLAYLQIDVRGSNADLHSGSFGGIVVNPLNALTKMLVALKDDSGHITIPGFYDDVVEISAEEHTNLARLPFDEAAFAQSIGAPTLSGEAGFSRLEQLWARPTLDINGIWGGYQGPGAKTVIPAEAYAKLSCRLVPNQDWRKISDQISAHLKSIAPESVDVTVTAMHGGRGYLTGIDSPAIQAVKSALAEGFATEAVLIREGGSIPIVPMLSETLNAEVLLVGFGLPDQNAHAPDENLDLENFHKGIRSLVILYQKLSEIKQV
ncbi:MAG: dipeptidase [Candidatus Marinimicrobia bacterium]|nr:dipeptidase [Candidatus Neomarinimicrobiota bacterium]